MSKPSITIIGAGLAGCEVAWQAASRGVKVHLHEMKPAKYSPAHHCSGLAELVCSNSFRGESLENAVGLLKEELRRCGSLFVEAADATRVLAGGAVAVDRELFSAYVTDKISTHPLIELIRGEVTNIPPDGVVIVASGPLTSDALADVIRQRTGEGLYFYDAIAPIVAADSIDMELVYRASRYGKGDGDDYLNCPLTEEEYQVFVRELLAAEKVTARDFEKAIHFEGCMPVEEMAERGFDTLRFGPMKPVGLPDPRTGKEPHAVVQLRLENRHASMYNLVGFQTKLTYPEQRRVFHMIPGLQRAEFVRLGSMHRNTFINGPRLLTATQQLRSEPRIFFAGQITGVEGYVESAASGFLAGIACAHILCGKAAVLPSSATALGALMRHVSEADSSRYQPMNVNYGLFPDLLGKVKKNDKRAKLAERALNELDQWLKQIAE